MHNRLNRLLILLALPAVALGATVEPKHCYVAGSGAGVAVDERPVPDVQGILPGHTVTADGDAVALVVLHHRVSLLLCGTAGGRGSLTRNGADPEHPGMMFNLSSGIVAFSVARNANVPFGINIRVNGTVVHLDEVRGLVKLENGAPVVAFASDSGFEQTLGSFGIPCEAAKPITRMLTAPGWSSGGDTGTDDTLIFLMVGVGCLLYVLGVVQPTTDGRGIAPVLAFLGLEYALSASRFWVALGGHRVPAGAFGLALFVMVWASFEKKPKRGSAQRQALVHLGRYLGLLFAANAIRWGSAIYATSGPKSFLTAARTLLDPSASPVLSRFDPTSETFVWELFVAFVPALVALMADQRR